MREPTPWPTPSCPKPAEEQLFDELFESMAEATDGCFVEPGEVCPHGHPSWLLRLEMV